MLKVIHDDCVSQNESLQDNVETQIENDKCDQFGEFCNNILTAKIRQRVPASMKQIKPGYPD